MMHKAKSIESRPVILCIEDEEDLRRDLAEELFEAGYDVVEACNGKEALDQLVAIRPDLILCDISMPGLNGYDVLRSVQEKQPLNADIPFVFLSALGDPREVVEGKRLGADDYLVKPVDYDLLLATIDARLRQIARIRTASEGNEGAVDVAALSASFELTPAEARVAVALTEGRRLADVAVDLNISRTTAAFHLRNIFQKTGVRRQAELVGLLLRPARSKGSAEA